jgi:hypothetical protein
MRFGCVSAFRGSGSAIPNARVEAVLSAALAFLRPCHQDVQLADGAALLLQYVTKYVAKFSDASFSEWFSDEASANSVARRVCFEYHPLEPEMVLQLAGANFRQHRLGTSSRGTRSIVAPSVSNATLPSYVHIYMDCAWRSDRMSLLEFLRKTTAAGRIAQWLRKHHTSSGSTESLEEYANQYIMRGEQVVAGDSGDRIPLRSSSVFFEVGYNRGHFSLPFEDP